MIFLSALLDVCELNHAKDIEKQLNEQFLKDTDVEAHIKLITRKSMTGREPGCKRLSVLQGV